MGEEEGKERREQEVEFDVGGEGGSDERNINVKPWNREMQVSELWWKEEKIWRVITTVMP